MAKRSYLLWLSMGALLACVVNTSLSVYIMWNTGPKLEIEGGGVPTSSWLYRLRELIEPYLPYTSWVSLAFLFMSIGFAVLAWRMSHAPRS